MTPERQAPPGVYHILLRAAGAADFRRAGTVPLQAVPVQGSTLEIDRGGRMLCGKIAAVVIPPGCEENCIGTVFLEEI